MNTSYEPQVTAAVRRIVAALEDALENEIRELPRMEDAISVALAKPLRQLSEQLEEHASRRRPRRG